MKEYTDAFRRQGIRVGFYYSPEDFLFLRGEGLTITRTAMEPFAPEVMERYRALLRAQMTELLTEFGPVDVLFFDGGETMRAGDGKSLQEVCMELAWDLQPSTLITRGAIPTPEQQLPGVGADMAWEGCITLGTAWQYQPTNETYKTGAHVIRLLMDTRARGGSLLLNVGPDARGALPAVQAAVASFVGTYEQMPPMYSALKVGGMKLYELAREGLEVERKTRPVRIERIDLMHQDETGLTMRVRCSKGTYIRTLCEDIGRKLGYGAHMTSLERTASGPYRVENSLPIDTIRQLVQTGSLAECVPDLNSLFADLPYKQVIAAEDGMLRNGNYLTYPMREVPGQVGQLYRMLTSDGALAGLYRITEVVGEKNRLRAYKMFV